MGAIVLKSTCSAVNDAAMPAWSDIANDVVVNEKRLQGSRCGKLSHLALAPRQKLSPVQPHCTLRADVLLSVHAAACFCLT